MSENKFERIKLEDEIIEKAIKYAQEIFKNEGSGHDYWHTLRVYNNALEIANNEKCNKFIIKLASLLHDVDDYKIFGGVAGQYDNAKRFMIDNNVDDYIINCVCKIINTISYKGNESDEIDTIEGRIVQDADRLDAIGAIGIARVFTFGGNKNREIFIPDKKYRENITPEEYQNNIGSSSINHFYEKLLKIKELMNTNTGKEIAKQRHDFMEIYLKEFFYEWDGKK